MTESATTAVHDTFADLEHLEDQRGAFAPITSNEKTARMQRLAELLREAHLDAFLVEPTATLAYLSDVTWGMSERLFGLVVLADGSHFWLAPSFEVASLRARIASLAADDATPHIVAWHEHEYAWRPLAAELDARRVDRIAVDPRARAFVVQSLIECMGSERVAPGQPIVRALRGTKSANELALLRGANEITKRAISSVAETLRPGMTDHEIGARMQAAQRRMGLTSTWVLPLLGEGAAYPHGSAAGRTLGQGDAILVDTGGALHGYQSDITRTWVFEGTASGDFLDGWNAVRSAQARAFEAIRPGVPCAEIDRAARAVIGAAGFGSEYEGFAHRLGHGIGTEGHEEPNLDGGSQALLEPGMTFSNEPGIYLPGRFGVRIEDVVLVTESGADVFGDWQAGPNSPTS